MKQSIRVSLFAILAVLAAAGGFAHLQIVAGQGSESQVVNVTAKKYEFDPSPIHVKQGTHVELRITAIDHTHGFQIDLVPAGSGKNAEPGLVFSALQKCWTLDKGKVTTIDFVAKTAGTYPFHCCHFCGFGHKGMKGTLIVDP